MKKLLVVIAASLSASFSWGEDVSPEYVRSYILNLAEQNGLEIDQDNQSITISGEFRVTLESYFNEVPDDIFNVITDASTFEFMNKILRDGDQDE